MITVWAEDEHRLGRLPVLRRIWAPRGQRPTAPVRPRYQWGYVYACVRPTMGQTWWGRLPTVRAAAMSLARAHFARDEGIDAMHRAVPTWDGAGWPTAGTLVVPDGIDLVPLPPASPELQPVERLWPLVDEAVANRTFFDLDALEDVRMCWRRGAGRCGRTDGASEGTPASPGGRESAARAADADTPPDYSDSV